MRSIWNGAISFGLVSIPVKLMNATENHSVSFRQVHLEDGGRIRYRKFCELEDKEVESAEIGKAFQDVDGTMIPITDEDLATLPIRTTKTIDIMAFVPADRIDPLQMDTAYYLAIGGAAAMKPYTLLREALSRSDRVAVTKFALRGKERLGVLRVVDDVIAMHGLLWPDEIRAPEDVAPDEGVTVRDAELDLAEALMDTLGEVDMADLHDDYREAVENMVAAKAEGAEPPARAESDSGGKVIDLMSALENSVKVAKKARDDGEPESEGPDADVHHIGGRKKRAPTSGEPIGSSGGRRAARTSPKDVSGKKSTSAAKKAPAKKDTASPSERTAGKHPAKGQQARKEPARKEPARKEPAKKEPAKKEPARKTASKGAASKGTAAKGTAAKKSAASGRRAS
ncbi:non-homologous end joining protein Ku [Streptomyces tsukubensis]|uniref:Non-homologous end joining protein Ku n=1 Tax=Streptomyces tsukubensis TaxID=83656 RepID=A0A1V4ABC9_9ACTN|nr:Ku protein [Streptomyces tsukubensis]OON81178.1 Ku protein [Streptomyces tsukubensis]QFR95708.1 Ku protein [Streptomyces tsukubensis]